MKYDSQSDTFYGKYNLKNRDRLLIAFKVLKF